MEVFLKHSEIKNSTIQITGSKSESNRLLILQALFDQVTVENVSCSDDSEVMQKALQSTSSIIDVHHAGTAMRFLTAYFACQVGRTVTLTGSDRMQQRPIGVLVDALRQLGADIEYVNKKGYPPLLIKGQTLEKSAVEIQANVSSQFISALLLIAPKLKNGLQLSLVGEITSVPYINMTLALLSKIGIKTNFTANLITVQAAVAIKKKHIVVESDWSSASYHYSLVALSPVGTRIKLLSYFKSSLQGDAVLANIYEQFGVYTKFESNAIILEKQSLPCSTNITIDLNDSPDIAQTIVVTCFGLGLSAHLTGLHTLKIKETDRLLALQTELGKLGASVVITENSLQLLATNKMNDHITIATYQDHRMAMAFAPLALKTNINFQQAEVVSKSYPTFWTDIAKTGIDCVIIE